MSSVGNRPLLVIVGPTAVGKTDAAIQVAQAINGEIISADSRQIYRYMDIGTAKPTLAQQAVVPHHMIDIVDPDEYYNVTDFQQQTFELIDTIHRRSRMPMLVGGTGQYIAAIVQGWRFPGVEANPQLRDELESYAEEYGWEALWARLQHHDPISAERIDGRNVRRVIRALEVCIETGRPFSEFQRKSPPSYTIKTFGLTLEDRTSLYQRADERIDRMMAAGLVAEVRDLMARGYAWNLPAMSALGYLQIGQYLRGEKTLDEALEELRRATRTFIRRQYTWFRKYNADATWLESTPDMGTRLTRQVKHWLAG